MNKKNEITEKKIIKLLRRLDIKTKMVLFSKISENKNNLKKHINMEYNVISTILPYFKEAEEHSPKIKDDEIEKASWFVRFYHKIFYKPVKKSFNKGKEDFLQKLIHLMAFYGGQLILEQFFQFLKEDIKDRDYHTGKKVKRTKKNK